MGKRILVVDDYRDAATVLAEVFTLFGYETEVAYSGQACLDRLAASPPVDVIFLDIDMPGVNGAEVIRSLMAQTPLPPLKIVAVTAWGGDWEGEWGPPGWWENDRYRTLVVGTFDKAQMSNPEALRAYLNELMP